MKKSTFPELGPFIVQVTPAFIFLRTGTARRGEECAGVDGTNHLKHL